jgi:hypothetical protein
MRSQRKREGEGDCGVSRPVLRNQGEWSPIAGLDAGVLFIPAKKSSLRYSQLTALSLGEETCLAKEKEIFV